jgi:superfamily II DNA/RNA helicase
MKKRARKPIVLVIVPTRELVTQVKKEYIKLQHSKNEFKVMGIYGGTDINQ